MPVEYLTLRESIIKEIMKRLDQATWDGKKLFNRVVRGNLDNIAAMACPACGVDEGDEQVIDMMYPYHTKILRVFINIKFLSVAGVDHYAGFNYYLGQVLSILVTESKDFQLGGLARDVQEVGNRIEVEGLQDPLPGGTIFLEVQYRHRTGDPSRQE